MVSGAARWEIQGRPPQFKERFLTASVAGGCAAVSSDAASCAAAVSSSNRGSTVVGEGTESEFVVQFQRARAVRLQELPLDGV